MDKQATIQLFREYSQPDHKELIPTVLKQVLQAQLAALYPNYITKYYSIDKVIAHLTKYFYPTGTVDNNPSIPVGRKERAFKWVNNQITNTLLNTASKDFPTNSDLAEFEFKAQNKWVGPQGSIPSWTEVLDIVTLYYDRYSEWSMDVNKLSEQTLTYIHAAIADEHTYDFGDKQHSISLNEFNYKRINDYPKPDRHSNSGIIGFSDRRNDAVYLKNWIQAKRYPLVFDPAVMGTRNMRNKNRGIYMDSLANWFRMWPEYTTLANTFKQSNAVHYAPQEYVDIHVQRFLSKHKEVIFFESDYESMDTWVTEGHANFTFDVVEKVKKGTFSDQQMIYIKQLNHQVFTMPIVTPIGLMTGKHNLLSGTLPTNYIETPLNLTINMDFVNEKVNSRCTRTLIYGVDFIILVLGDDVLIIFDKNIFKDQSDFSWLRDEFCTFVWNKYRIQANVSKQRVSETSGFFCKRQLRRSNRQRKVMINGRQMNVNYAAYPITLVMNNILWPERNHYVSKAQYLITIFARLDNAVGSPLFKNLVVFVRDSLCAEFKDVTITQQDIDEYNMSPRTSFRVKLYGETFSIENSPSARIWFNI